jgi:hypothetical protein
MFGVILIVIILIVVLISFFLNNYFSSESIVVEKEQLLKLKREKLSIIEKKFLKGKIKEKVFYQLKKDLSFETILLELEVFALKKNNFLKLELKLEQLFERIKKPTKYKRAKLKNLLKESEIIRLQLNIIEKKLLKNEINQETFEKLLGFKENEMTEKEAQIISFLNNSN